MDLIRQGPKRVFLECTRTLNSPLHTGIERVVRNIIAASLEVAATMNLDCVPVVFRPRHGFVPLEAELLRSMQEPKGNRPLSRLKRQLEHWGLIGLARTSRRCLQQYSATLLCGLQRFSRSKMQFGPDDVLLLLDSSWTTPYWASVRQAQRAGALVGATVYDLLPIQFPDSMTASQRTSFGEWWNQVYHEIDFITAISQSIYGEALSYHERCGTRSEPLTGGAFPLGADFLPGPADAAIRQQLRALMEGHLSGRAKPFYLCVGTLSPRKQQALVLDAFERLWNLGDRATLVFAGGSGWYCDDLIRRMQSHRQFGKALFWFSDLSDSELNWCYQHARGLIAASKGEGFDLPVVEALRQECPVLASDIPVHREVAGTFAGYFPSNCARSLAELVAKHLRNGRLEKTTPVKQFAWPDWNQSCEELLRLIIRLSGECKERRSALRKGAA